MKGEHKEFPLPPAPSQEFNFINGAGMSYEAKHVRECLRKGKGVEDSWAEGWQGKPGEAYGRFLPSGTLPSIGDPSSIRDPSLHQPLKQLLETPSLRTPQGTIYLNVCALWDSGNCSSFGLLGGDEESTLSSPAGLKESPVIPLAESELLADILEEVRKAIGVTFPQDKW